MQLKDAGIVWTYPRVCGPLDDVKIVFEWNQLKGQKVRFLLIDADHQPYFEKTITAGNGKAELVVKAGGKPGVHQIDLWVLPSGENRRPPAASLKQQHQWVLHPGEHPYPRHGGFRVCAKTGISSDTGEMDELLALLEEGLRQTIDITYVNGKPRTYYKHADNTRENLAFPAFGVGSLRYFIQDLKSMFEAVYDNQWPDGRLPDHVYGDNYWCPITPRKLRTCMADLEIGSAWTLCVGWQAHGDDKWLRKMLPKVEAGLEFVVTDPRMYDGTHGVIKRPHTLDEWDIGFTETGENANTDETVKFVIMQGDTSQLYLACVLLAEAYAALGDRDRASRFRMLRDHYRKLGNELFWDGVKYKHHIHLDPFDHKDFDEDDQLAMSNSAAITRGFADHKQAVSIIKEYVRRWKKTGDRFPWWSLQPGYPDKLGYLRGGKGMAWSKLQGEYANGGLFPWVGGELCRGAFQHGMEKLACRLLRDIHYVLKRDQGALFTWYHLDGSAAMNAPHNQTNYDPWGFQYWTQAVIEELAGIKPEGKLFERVLCAPRWPATKTKKASATAHFPASDTHFSYKYERSKDHIRMYFTGTGKDVSFRILLPGWPQCRRVTLDGKKVGFKIERLEKSVYVTLEAKIKGVRELIIAR